MCWIASRKRAADILSNETDEEGDDHHAQSPRSKVRRIGRTGPPAAGSQDTGMVQSILDANLDSMDESDKEDKEDQEDQEYQEDAEAEAEEDMEQAEAEENMEEVEGEENVEEAEGEQDKFAGEEVSADCYLIQIPNRLLRPGGSERRALHCDQRPQVKGIKVSYAL